MHKKINHLILILLLLFAGQVIAVDNFALFTIPKSGTFILIKLFRYKSFGCLTESGAGAGPTCYLHAHFHQTQPSAFRKNMPHKVVITTRDLRDNAFSLVEWYSDYKGFPFVSDGLVDQKLWYSLSTREKLEALFLPEIWGKSELVKNCEELRNWLPHHDDEKIYWTSFEKLVGPQGGGTLEGQEREILNIASFIDVSLDQEDLDHITSTIFGGTYSFNKGQIGRGKIWFDEDLQELANPYIEDLQAFFGYDN